MTKRKQKMDLALATTEDKIYAYMVGSLTKEELTPNEHKIRKRWLQVWGFLREINTPSKAVEMHMKAQQALKEPICERTAWLDYKHATKMLGDVYKSSQRANFILLYEWQVDLFKKAMEAHELAEANRAIKNLIAINENLPDQEAGIAVPMLFINMNVNGDGKKVKLDDLKNMKNEEINQVIEDIEHTEVSDEEVIKLIGGSTQSDKI